jgi:hypothetical protein
MRVSVIPVNVFVAISIGGDHMWFLSIYSYVDHMLLLSVYSHLPFYMETTSTP